MANILCDEIKNLNIEHKYNEDFNVITVSIGICIAKTDHTTIIDKFYDNADKSLYESKQNGRNKVTLHKE